MSPSEALVRDVADVEFEHRVLERSRELPVVADFWAPWCGPCRALGPMLERLAEAFAGEFELARINVDEAQRIAQQLRVQSIPTVIGFRDGQPVAQFVGAQPESEVRAFLAHLLPSEADKIAAEGAELAAAGHDEAAEARFRAALEEAPGQAVARLGLAKLLLARGEEAAALEELERVAGAGPELAEAEQLAAQLRTRADAEAVSAGPELEKRLAADPDDHEARIALGRGLAASGKHEEALELLLEAVRRAPDYGDGAARRAMLDVFTVLGGDHDLTRQYRAALARALYR